MLIQENTLRALNSFYPFVQTVVFSKITIKLKDVESHLLFKPLLRQRLESVMIRRTNPYGTPFFKDMLIYLEDNYRSTFYGFCNGDILFHSALLLALQEIKRNIDLKLLLHNAGSFNLHSS